MFKFSLVSDLHLDHPQPKTPPFEKNVLVAGDCGNGLIGLKYLQRLKNKGHTVHAVTGNHEHYCNVSSGRSVLDTEQQFHAPLGQLPRPVELEPGLWLIMVNGWYRVRDYEEDHWRSYMNDSRYIGVSAAQVTALAEEDAAFVKQWLSAVEWQGDRAIVMTHTAPCQASLDPRFEGSDSNAYYWNPFMEPLLKQFQSAIALWLHGHTHAAVDVVHEGVRVLTNPRGYPRESPNWKPLTVTVCSDGQIKRD